MLRYNPSRDRIEGPYAAAEADGMEVTLSEAKGLLELGDATPDASSA